jgi:hypothetical protein
MADRLTVQQFFEALRAQNITPLVDTPAVRASVDSRVRVLCVDYPIQDRWPVLDLETAYEQTLNDLPNLLDLARDGYLGTVKLRDFDETYAMDEWNTTDFRTYIRIWVSEILAARRGTDSFLTTPPE